MTRHRYDVAVIGGGIVGTHLSRLLVRQGRSVALIERGPGELSRRGPALPKVKCMKRFHRGAVEARNHVLGGNGHFWGGALVCPAGTLLGESLGYSVIGSGDRALAEDIGRHYRAAEADLGLHRSPKRGALEPGINGVGACNVAEALVLPGKARNVSSNALRELNASNRCDIFAGAEVSGFSRGTTQTSVGSVEIRYSGGAQQILANKVVIAAGTIDSIVLVARNLAETGVKASRTVGASLHDHLSVPLFSIDASRSPGFRRFTGISFEHGAMIARRYELRADSGWGARAFLHFQCLFDEVSPYREIKQLLALRQQGVSAPAIGMAALSMIGHLPALGRIAVDRYLHGTLHVSAEVPIVATLDFESFPSPLNAIDVMDAANVLMTWDVHQEDENTFDRLLGPCQSLVARLTSEYGVSVEPVGDFSTSGMRGKFLREKATDTFHLGGGLQVGGAQEGGVVDSDLRLHGLDNVFVLSSAVLRRPGVVNPTLTLLALANRFAETN